MDKYLLSIKATDQQLVHYLNIYKLCRTAEERYEVQQLILQCEAWITHLRAQGVKETVKEFPPR